MAALTEATPCLVNETVTALRRPGTCSGCERTGSPPAAEVQAPRPGSSAGPSAGIVP